MSRQLRNTGACVRARLLTLARTKGQAFDLLLTRYAIERLLYRLSVSRHRDRLVLKGAMLASTWFAAGLTANASDLGLPMPLTLHQLPLRDQKNCSNECRLLVDFERTPYPFRRRRVAHSEIGLTFACLSSHTRWLNC